MILSVTTPLRSWSPLDNYRNITLRKCEKSVNSRVEVCCKEQVVRKDGKSPSAELWSSWELRKPRTYTVRSLGKPKTRLGQNYSNSYIYY